MSDCLYIARHGETVFNAVGRMQGEAPHTPLTRAGFAQAEAMGEALRDRLGPRPPLELWASPTGRALQTLAIIAEHLDLDWHRARTDARLGEIHVGDWGGLYYRDIRAGLGPSVDSDHGLFGRTPPNGESPAEVAARLRSWLGENSVRSGDRLIVMHGVSSRILRGLLVGAPPRPGFEAPFADRLPQGSVVAIRDGAEELVHRGQGGFGASGPSA